MRFAYADPPYPQQAAKHYGKEAAADGRTAREVNHGLLIAHLCDDYPDGWALSTSVPALESVLALCPPERRIGSWVKPFASFKKGVTRAWCWEPVIFCGGRPIPTTDPTVRDFVVAAADPDPEPAVVANITLKRGVSGAKPVEFMRWVLDFLNVEAGDTVDDLFPGSGVVQLAIDGYLNAPITTADSLFGGAA